jgi:signal transduction histidine kinase
MQEMRRLAQRTLALADDFVRIVQAAQRPLQPEDVDAGELAEEVLADFGAQALAAGVQLQRARPWPAVALCVDRALVLRALGNLLSNAIKNSPAATTVRLALIPPGPEGAGFRVGDEGAGLDGAAMRRLMQQHDGLLPRAGDGVGFGLLFVQRVAQRHAGRLRVRRGDDGRGAVFELLLQRPSGNP